MLGFLIPNGLQRIFVDLARNLPLPWQNAAFSILCIVFLLLSAIAVRRLLLWIDCETAFRARQSGRAPGVVSYAIGWSGQIGLFFIIGVSVMFLLTLGGFEAARASGAADTSQSAIYGTARTVFLCLRPGSGTSADSLRNCAK